MRTSIVTLLILLFSCTACITITNAGKIKGNGKLVTKDIRVSDFSAIEIGQGVECGSTSFMKGSDKSPVFDYSQRKGSASLKITIDENLYPLLKFKTSGGKLSVWVDKSNRIVPTRMEITGSSEGLSRVNVSGCIDFNLQSDLSGDELELYVSGASDLNLLNSVRVNDCKVVVSGAGDLRTGKLTCRNMDCKVSGSGDADLKGEAEDAVFRVSGSGDIKAFDFDVKRLDCAVSGSGDIKAYATETLDAKVSGSGDIKYKGNASAKTHVSGSGDIDKVD